MLHGTRLSGGKVSWYRNRWFRTKVYEGADRIAPDNMLDRTISTANTHVVAHGGRILCLEEGAFPYEVDMNLRTLGPRDFGGRLTTAFTAHPKLCGATGEMLAFGYGFADPYLTYHRLDAAGTLVQSEVISVPGPTMMHDFAATRNHVIFFDLPVVFDIEAAMTGQMPYGWSDTYGARMGVMPRTGADADVKWFEIDPCYVFHTMNAFEDQQGRIVLDAGRHASMWRGGADQFEPSFLHRWTFDLATGVVRENQLDDVSHAFPRVDMRRECLGYRYGYAQMTRDPASKEIETDSVIVKYDMITGQRVVHEFGPGKMCGEPVFVASSANAAEDDGYVMTYVYDRASDSSSFVIMAGQDLAGPLVAEVALPQRVPHGFHGSWVAA